MRCPRSEAEECRFFLWEKDDVAAREAKISEIQSPSFPQTPSSNRHSNVRERGVGSSYLTTPYSGADSARRTLFQQSNNTSPTPQRNHAAQVMLNDKEVGLYTDVMALLHSDNIVLNSSTQMQLQLIINMAVELSETKTRMYQEALKDLSKKLKEAERRGPNVSFS